jgi:hypothetical protein
VTATLAPVPPVVPAPDEYLALVDHAIAEAEALLARRRAAADTAGADVAAQALELVRDHRVGAVEEGVPSRRDGFGFALTRFAGDRTWSDDADPFLDALEAMQDYWQRHL